MNPLILYLVVGLITALALGRIFFRSASPKKKRNPHWSDGLLSSDHRSFETIYKQHQRSQ